MPVVVPGGGAGAVVYNVQREARRDRVWGQRLRATAMETRQHGQGQHTWQADCVGLNINEVT